RRVRYEHRAEPECRPGIRARSVAVSSFVFVQSLAADRASRTRGGRKITWEQAFGDEVESYLPGERVRALVALLRGDDDTAEATARALMKAVREGGRCDLLIDDVAIRPVEVLVDAEIGRRASVLPVNLIAVVRSARGDAGKVRSMAMVALYSPGGKALG